MKKQCLGAIAVALALASLPMATARATSTSQIPTKLMLLPGSQSVTYANRTVTVDGTLETVVPTGSTPQPLPGESVTVSLEEMDGTVSIPLGSEMTDSNGHFVLTTTLPAPGYVRATFAATSAYAGSTGVANIKDAAPLMPAKIVFSAVPPTPPGSRATATGHVLMQLADGIWVPSPFAPVQPVAGANISVVPEHTDVNGDFTATFTVRPDMLPVFYTWSVGTSWSDAAFSAPLVVPLSVYPSTAQLSPAYGSREDLRDMAFMGVTEYVSSDDQVLRYPDAPVKLYYQPLGSSLWILRASGRSDAAGRFLLAHVSGYLPGRKLALPSGLWRLEVMATATYLAGQSGSISVFAQVPVWLNRVGIAGSGKRARITGVLDDDYRSGPVGGQTVRITWDRGRQKATVRTGANGRFSFSLFRRPAGIYEVAFVGGAAILTAYVPQRKNEHLFVRYSGT
jgi:hypothetical protein